ncbi:hypothetical protein [Nocardiopsis sp. CNT312]|uniref:hypothetical protein n=1 Tax=Nocardiopsis sp. CNT312 TaxID=1137268 RepID=UPI00048CC66F|nr:hypothetical protein [Nocardiopsis sp. CNT312]
MAHPPARHLPPGVTPLAPGDPHTIGSYQLIGRLYDASAATVYAALTDDGTPTALTRTDVRAEPGAETALAERIAAARAASGLCAVAARDGGLHRGAPWTAVPFLPGRTLRRQLQEQGPITGRALVTAAAGYAEAVGALHAAGLVHGDVGPDTACITADGPRLVDHGLGRWIRRSASDASGDVASWARLVLFAAGRTPARPGHLPDGLDSLIRRALSPDPAARPEMEEVHLELLLLLGIGEDVPAQQWPERLAALIAEHGPYADTSWHDPARWRNAVGRGDDDASAAGSVGAPADGPSRAASAGPSAPQAPFPGPGSAPAPRPSKTWDIPAPPPAPAEPLGGAVPAGIPSDGGFSAPPSYDPTPPSGSAPIPAGIPSDGGRSARSLSEMLSPDPGPAPGGSATGGGAAASGGLKVAALVTAGVVAVGIVTAGGYLLLNRSGGEEPTAAPPAVEGSEIPVSADPAGVDLAAASLESFLDAGSFEVSVHQYAGDGSGPEQDPPADPFGASGMQVWFDNYAYDGSAMERQVGTYASEYDWSMYVDGRMLVNDFGTNAWFDDTGGTAYDPADYTPEAVAGPLTAIAETGEVTSEEPTEFAPVLELWHIYDPSVEPATGDLVPGTRLEGTYTADDGATRQFVLIVGEDRAPLNLAVEVPNTGPPPEVGHWVRDYTFRSVGAPVDLRVPASEEVLPSRPGMGF